jgi:tryptophan synthase alpha chain
MQLLEKKSPHAIGLIGHTIINYPTPKVARDIIKILVENKVKLVELQIPFSEPIADGPIFTQANNEAIKNGVTLSQCFDFLSEMKDSYPVPFVLMTYANIIFKYGFKQFVKTAKSLGAKGAIIPDLPLDISPEYLKACAEYEFAAIPVLSPNMTDQRLKEISHLFNGFIYAVARTGVTGIKTEFNSSIISYLQKLKKFSDLPIAIGFGISSGKDLNFLRGYADYAVIGTQTIRAYQEQGLKGVNDLWQELGGGGLKAYS